MSKKEKAVFRVFLVIGGFAMIIDGVALILSLGFYSPSFCLKLAKIRTNWMLRILKSKK